MLNLTEYMLTRLAEECVEIAQRCTKALTYGLHEKQPGQELDNLQRITGEFLDLMGTMDMLEDMGIVIIPHDESVIQQAINAKQDRIRHFMAYSRRQGALAPAKFPLTMHENGTDTLQCKECDAVVYPSAGDYFVGSDCPDCLRNH